MTDRIAITPHQAAEYEVLLEFYDAWEMFHAIPGAYRCVWDQHGA